MFDNQLYEQQVFEAIVIVTIKNYKSVSLCVFLEFLPLRGEK